jgi:hypothetical protein
MEVHIFMESILLKSENIRSDFIFSRSFGVGSYSTKQDRFLPFVVIVQ